MWLATRDAVSGSPTLGEGGREVAGGREADAGREAARRLGKLLVCSSSAASSEAFRMEPP